MEEMLKSLEIGPKFLAKRSNAMWDVLLAKEEKARQLASNIDHKNCSSSDGVYGHPKDNSDCTWGVLPRTSWVPTFQSLDRSEMSPL